MFYHEYALTTELIQNEASCNKQTCYFWQ